jgi:hypothetical protein
LIKGILIMLSGLLLIYVGWRHWRFRRHESVGFLEMQMLNLLNEEPLPKSKLDHFLTYAQAILGLAFGSMFAFLGVVVILGELDLL